MADTNGTTDEVQVENETAKPVTIDVTKQKTEVLGNDGDGSEKTPEDKKPEINHQLSPEVLAKRIKRQIEYYFGDFNLPTDKFLKSVVKEKDGWVSIETLLKFNRLSILTKEAPVIVEALQGSELVQVSEDKTEVRRNPEKPLPEESEARRKEILARSVYVKGFPQDEFTMDSALDFFEQFGPTDDVVMRFWQDKAEKVWKFKGSVFIKFPTKDAAKEFLDLEEVKYKATPLKRMWQEEYIDQKRKERLDQKMLKRKNPDNPSQENNRANKRLKIEEEKELPKNATLHIAKCPKGLTREMLKEKVEGLGVTVAFVDYNKGDEQAWVRLHEEGSATKVLEQCEEGVLKLEGDIEVTLRTLEGDEEATFLESAKQSITARRAKGNQRGGKRGGRGGGRGGRGGGRGRNRRYQNTDSMIVEGSGDEGD